MSPMPGGLKQPISSAGLPITLNLNFWVRADLGVTAPSGIITSTNGGIWQDQSGNGVNKGLISFRGGSDAASLNTTDAEFNGQPSITLSSVNSVLYDAALWAVPQTQPWTMYVVCYSPGIVGNGSIWTGVTSGFNQTCGFAQLGGGTRQFASNNGKIIDSFTQIAATPVVVCCVYNGSSSATYINAISTAAITGDMGAGGFAGMMLGNAFNIGNTAPGIRIAENIIYGSAHGSSERAQLMNYMGARYAISIST